MTQLLQIAQCILAVAMLVGCASQSPAPLITNEVLVQNDAPPPPTAKQSDASRAESKLAKVDLSSMTASKMFDQRSLAAASPMVCDQFIAVLSVKSKPDTVEGFECAVLQEMLISQRENRPIYALPLLDRAAAAEGLKTKVGSELLDSMSTSDPSALVQHAAVVRALIATLHEKQAPAAIITKLDTLIAVARLTLPSDEANAAHAAAITCVTSKLKSNSKNVELLRAEQKQYDKGSTESKDKAKQLARIELSQLGLRRTLRQLESTAGRGELTGRNAPELHCEWVRNADGSTPWTQVSDLKGKIVVIDFWATWCGPCVASFRKIAELRARYPEDKVAIVGVTSLQGRVAHRKRAPVKCADNTELEHAETLIFMQEMGMTWTVAVAKEDVFNKEFGVVGIPSLAILDRSGQVVRAGMSPSDEPSIRAIIDQLLASDPASKRAP